MLLPRAHPRVPRVRWLSPHWGVLGWYHEVSDKLTHGDTPLSAIEPALDCSVDARRTVTRQRRHGRYVYTLEQEAEAPARR